MKINQSEWAIALNAWIIQDRNYDNFHAGQNAEFALEFHPCCVRSSDTKVKSADRLGAVKYEINAEIVYLTPEVWVLDFGVLAYQESKPPEGLGLGDFVTTEIYLGIDPFFYFEYLHRYSGIPPMIYSWKVNSIEQQTAPFVESLDSLGRKVLVRDETKLGYKAISKTDAWKDDNQHGEYVLTCARLDVPAKFERAPGIT